MADAVDTALDEYAAAPDVEDYAYAAGLIEPPPSRRRRAGAAPEDEYAIVESAEPDAWQPEGPWRPRRPRIPRSPRRGTPESRFGRGTVDIVTVVDDLLDGPD